MQFDEVIHWMEVGGIRIKVGVKSVLDGMSRVWHGQDVLSTVDSMLPTYLR